MAESTKDSQLNNDFDDDAYEDSQLDAPLTGKKKKTAGRRASDSDRKRASANGGYASAGTRSGAGARGAASTGTRSGAGSRSAASAGTRSGAGSRSAASAGTRSGAGTRSAASAGTRSGAGTRSAASAGTRSGAGTRSAASAGTRSGAGNGSTALAAARGGAASRSGVDNGMEAGRKQPAGRSAYENQRKENPVSDDIVIILVALLCVLMVLSYCGICGPVGIGINIAVFGLFGKLGYVLPFLIFFMTVFFVANKEKNVSVSKFIYTFLFMCMAAGLIQMIGGGYDEELKLTDYFTNSRIDIEQVLPTYGGLLGGAMVTLFCPFVGKVATVIILIALTLILFVLSTGKAFITYISRKINKKAHNIYENRKIEREERRLYQDSIDYDDYASDDYEDYDSENQRENTKTGRRRRMGTFDVETGRKKQEQELPEDEDGQLFYPDEPGHLSEVTKNDYNRTSENSREADASLGFLDRLKNRNSRKNKPDMTDASDEKSAAERFREEEKAKRWQGTGLDSGSKASEDLHQLENEQPKKDSENDTNGFSENELNKKFADKPSIDLINLRPNPNPIQKPTTRQYYNTDEDNNIVRMPISKRLHAGSTNLEDDSEAVSYRIHGLNSQDNQTNADNTDNAVTAEASATDASATYKPEDERIMYSDEENDVTDLDTPADTDDMWTEADENTRSCNITRIGSLANSGGFYSDSSVQSFEDEDDSEKVTVFKKADVSKRTDEYENTDASEKADKSELNDSSETTFTSEPVAVRDSSGAVRFTDMNAKPAATQEQAVKPVEYQFPPVSLLSKSKGRTGSNSDIEQELEDTIKLLQRTFESFGVGVTVTDASVGPTVTRYELLPNQGVKVKTITALSDDIKLALAAPEIRMEAPIPGKSAVGIEVPNKTSEPVLFGDLVDSDVFRNSKSKISFAVGKDISGESIVSNIGSMPHALIAGATGSGKSVCINALIMSILYKAKPNEVKMIMVDPKRVELVGYNGIPHLLVPVVTDVKKASGALNWALAEMDNRYQLFADNAVTNLASYNKYVEEKYHEEGNVGECPDKLPQILIIIDELNDLMMTANSKEVEAAICRLTQLARACGIHVILATQRPSVNVLTGTIKANIPTRIAFSVSSIVDSRTILDQQGAEKLLGKGDMLFYPAGYVKPVRVQGVYVSDDEVKRVVQFIKDQYKDYKYNADVSKHIDSNSDPKSSGQSVSAADDQGSSANGRDEYFNEAGKLIIEKQKASIGSLQRVYKIGFNRAARIMDQLADAGVVGPEEGTKPRKILMTLQEFEEFISLDEQ